MRIRKCRRTLADTSHRLLDLASHKEVAAGLDFTVVLTLEGHVYTCGTNEDGQLGHGDTKKRNIFAKVDMLDGFVVQVSAGAAHALAVTRDGFAFSWGHGGNWCLGYWDMANQPRPCLIEKLKDENIFVTGISAGCEHSVALDSSGQVYTWGRNTHGGLGHGSNFDVVYPQSVEALIKVRAVQICARPQRTFVLSDNGRLYGFGKMGFGSLKLSGTTVLDSLKDNPICQVSAGPYHNLVVTCEGNVLGFGDGRKGQLGKQHLRICSEPIEIVDLDLLAPAPFE